MSGMTIQANPVPWKHSAPVAAITVFKKTMEEADRLQRIEAFAKIRRDNGTFFFTEAQQMAISSQEKTISGPEMLGLKKKSRVSKNIPALPAILKVQTLVAIMLSGCSVKEIARMAHMHSILHAQGFRAIINQLMTKESYTWKELNDYRQALGLASVNELLTLFPVVASKTKNLDLSNLNINSIPSIEQLLKFFPHLTSVNFEGYEYLTDAAVRALADSKCTDHLTSVNFTYCKTLTDATVRALVDKCPRLTSVNFTYCRNLTDATVKTLVDKCPHLTSVNFAGCDRLTDAEVRALADSKCAHHLTSVNFTSCNNLTDAAVIALADKCTSLTSVNLANCTNLTDAAVRALADKCPRLTSVDFEGCSYLTDAAVNALADSRCADHLTDVDFTDCYNFTDAAVIALADKCPRLTSVNFTSCDNLTDAAVIALADKCPCLTSTNFENCYFFTDAAVIALAGKCHRLTDVNFDNCNGLTDAAVRALADKCPNLTSVNFTKCDRLTDVAVRALTDSRCADHLTGVDFTECKKLTDAAVRALARCCSKLTYIFVSSNLKLEFGRYRKEFAYKQPTSALGKLYRALLDEAPIEVLKQAIVSVDNGFLNPVYGNVWNLSGKPQGDDKQEENHSLDENKRSIFIAALQKLITDCFESLPQDDKNSIYGKVSDFRRDRNPLDSQWGKNNALDNRVLLADLLSEGARIPHSVTNLEFGLRQSPGIQ